MIKIGKNKKNYIYTTFSERMDDVDNDILLVFENETNPGVSYSIILEDKDIIGRIDKYEIEENTHITDGSTHSITLPYVGFYTYNAYEVIKDTNGDDVYKHIEKGRCKVYGSTQSFDTDWIIGSGIWIDGKNWLDSGIWVDVNNDVYL